MTKSFARYRHFVQSACALFVLFGASDVFANQAPKSKLLEIARQYVDRVGTKLNAPQQNDSDDASESQEDLLTMIPDGESMLFIPQSARLIYVDPISAIKENGQIYMLLSDMAYVLEIAIRYDAKTKRASGWYLYENWPVNIDLADKTVQSKDRNFKLEDRDFVLRDDDLYLSVKAVSKWLDTQFNLDLAQQYVEIKPPFPLPAVQREARKNKGSSQRSSNIAILPRRPQQYDWLDINTADITGRTSFRKAGEGNRGSRTRHDGTAIFEGQFLKQDAHLLLNGDAEDGMTGVTARLSRESENPDLLGPLRARSYAVGDVDATDIPLLGDTTQSLGARISNSRIDNVDFGKADINGDAQPGWDVELYRDGYQVASQRVDQNGRFEFDDVQLYAGDNEFEVFFYGPQGEIRTEKFQMPVTEEILTSQKNTYDVSFNLAEERTYQRQEPESEDNGTPIFSGRYNTVIGNSLVYAAARNRDIDGSNRTILGTGITKLIGGAVVDGNLGIDDKANTASQLQIRRNFGPWQTQGTALVQDENYLSETDNARAQTLLMNASAVRNFLPPFGTNANISLQGGYQEFADGNDIKSGSIGLSHQAGRVNISNAVSYIQDSTLEDDRINDTLSVRYSMGRLYGRAGVSYEIKPDSGVNNYFTDLTYDSSDRLSTNLYVTRDPEDRQTTGRVSVSYSNDYFRTSPFVEYNNSNDLAAGVSVNFSAVKPPSQALPMITSKRLLGRGLVSAFVFLDRNGNNIFDKDDRPLPDVMVESPNINKREVTNERGYSLLEGLSTTRASDITIDPSTLPDSYMISGFDGVSIFPAAGEITELEFPVHMSGQITGAVKTIGKAGSPIAGGVSEINLIPIDGRIRKIQSVFSESDGYFEMAQVPPGRYLMTVSDESAKNLDAGADAPQIIEIGYEGAELFDQNIALREGIQNVPISTRLVVSGVRENIPLYTLKVKEGGGNSSLLSMIRQFSMVKAAPALFDGLQKIPSPSADKNKFAYYRFSGNEPDRTFARCQAMLNDGLECEMVLFVRDVLPKPWKTASVEN